MNIEFKHVFREQNHLHTKLQMHSTLILNTRIFLKAINKKIKNYQTQQKNKIVSLLRLVVLRTVSFLLSQKYRNENFELKPQTSTIDSVQAQASPGSGIRGHWRSRSPADRNAEGRLPSYTRATIGFVQLTITVLYYRLWSLDVPLSYARLVLRLRN